METPRKILVLSVVLCIVGSTLARVYVFDDGRPYQRVQRSKRQVTTPARTKVPSHERELHHAPRAPRQSPDIQNARWELGYDPSDILNPPGLETAETQYRTLGFYKRNADIESPAIIWGTPKQGVVVNRPQRSSLEGALSAKREAREEDEEEEEEEDGAGYSQEGHSYHHVPASIYSFVKTDPHGNFKWGVHRGPPVRG